MSALTRRDLCGPVCIFLDDEWKNGNVTRILENHIVYSIDGNTDEFEMLKDEAISIIRTRKFVSSSGKGKKYTGNNPLVFGPAGASIYGKRIVERKDRPNSYRVEIKYKPLKYGRVIQQKINLGKHPNFESAEQVCDEKISEWLVNRSKFAAQKRKRRSSPKTSAPAPWITKIYPKNAPSKECNTPKRSANSLRRGRSAGPISETNVFSSLHTEYA